LVADRFHPPTNFSHILDLEHWKRADVPVQFQGIVDRYEKEGLFRDVPHHSGPLDKQASEFLVLGGEKFVVMGCALFLNLHFIVK